MTFFGGKKEFSKIIDFNKKIIFSESEEKKIYKVKNLINNTEYAMIYYNEIQSFDDLIVKIKEYNFLINASNFSSTFSKIHQIFSWIDHKDADFESDYPKYILAITLDLFSSSLEEFNSSRRFKKNFHLETKTIESIAEKLINGYFNLVVKNKIYLRDIHPKKILINNNEPKFFDFTHAISIENDDKNVFYFNYFFVFKKKYFLLVSKISMYLLYFFEK